MRRRVAPSLAFDGPPPLTLGLRRFVLRSVGPVAARFHPLDLELITQDGSLARRALCVLTNTGGKSTLLKLLCAVVNPGTAGLIGKGEIADMVLATDTSHVVLEWQEADGARYVTGWVGQWAGLQKPQSGQRGLQQWWYAFRVNGVGVDDLPFEHSGGRSRINDFRNQLRGLFSEHPACAGFGTESQSEWRRALAERTRIDAELFRYQATMNAAESGAAALVTSLKTPDAFVRFFIAAFDDETLTTALFHEIGGYTTQAADRAGKEAHAELCGELAHALEIFRNKDADYAAAAAMAAYDTERRRELAGRVRARAAVEAERAVAIEAVLTTEEEALAVTKRSIDGYEDRRRQYSLIEAKIRHNSAVDAQRRAREAETAADLAQRAWQVVPAVVAHDGAVSAHAQAKTAFDAAETELAPLRARVEESARLLVAGLNVQAARADAEAAVAGANHQAATAASSAAVRLREVALQDGAGLRQELAAADAQSARAVQLVAEGRERGDIGPSDNATDAFSRWTAAQDDAVERSQRALAEKDRQVEARRESERDSSSADTARRDAVAVANNSTKALAEAAGSCVRLLDDPNIAAVTGFAPTETLGHRLVPDSVAAAAAAAIEARAEEVERSALDTYAEISRIRVELARLAGTDLLAASEDVVQAVDALRAAHIGAVTGWVWLAGAVSAEDRLAFVASRPDIANGVVVSNPSRLDDARQTLEKVGLLPRLAVVVTTTRTATATSDHLPVDPDLTRFVVEPHPGLYDKDKAEEEIARLDGSERMLGTQHGEQQGRVRELRSAAAAARRHAETWPADLLDQIERRRDEAGRALASALERRLAAEEAVKAATLAIKQAGAAERAATDDHRSAGAAVLRLAEAVRVEADAEAHAAARPEIVERITRHDREAQAAGERAKEADRAAEFAAGQQREAVSVARASRDRAMKVNAVPAAPAPTEPVHVLEARYVELDRRLQGEAAGRDHHEALRRAEAAVAITAEPLSAVAPDALERARELSVSVMAATPEAVRVQTAAAIETWKSARDRLGDSRYEVGRWASEVEKHRPTGRQVHVVLSPKETPSDADDAARRAAEMDGRLVAARALGARQEAACATSEQARDAARLASSSFARLVYEQDFPVASAEPYLGDVDSAHADLDQRRKAVADAKDEVRDAGLARQEATSEVNRRANDRRWAVVRDSSLRERCATAKAEELSEHGERYLAGLRDREKSLRADVADLDTHRATVISSLGQTCDRLRRNLRQVKSASTLPAGVANVGGHHAIAIDFKPLPAEAADAALAGVVDEWAVSGADLVDNRSRQARLVHALSATVENRPVVGRWSVRVLKPRIDGDVTYCTPDRVTKEYSGGQELTLALLLYCALVAVRAADRSGNVRPPGLLLLDNPFGAASNERLIEMWQKLAEEADVQLLCFTALSEPSILNGFNGPGTFRQTLRNDRDQRNGHMHVRPVRADAAVERLVAIHLGGPPLEPGEEGRVHGLGYQTKAPFVKPETQPEAAS